MGRKYSPVLPLGVLPGLRDRRVLAELHLGQWPVHKCGKSHFLWNVPKYIRRNEVFLERPAGSVNLYRNLETSRFSYWAQCCYVCGPEYNSHHYHPYEPNQDYMKEKAYCKPKSMRNSIATQFDGSSSALVTGFHNISRCLHCKNMVRLSIQLLNNQYDYQEMRAELLMGCSGETAQVTYDLHEFWTLQFLFSFVQT